MPQLETNHPEETLLERQDQALQLWNQGKHPSFSTNIADFLTCGYGELDWVGEFKYPLEPADEYMVLVKNLMKSNVGFEQ